MVAPLRKSSFPDLFPLADFQDDGFWVDFLTCLEKTEVDGLEALWASKCGKFPSGAACLDSLREFVDEDESLDRLDPEILWKLPDLLEKWLMVLVQQGKVEWEEGNGHAGYFMKRLFSFILIRFKDRERFLKVLIDFFVEHSVDGRLRPILLCQIILAEGSVQQAWSQIQQLAAIPSFPHQFLPAALGILSTERDLSSWENRIRELVSSRADFSLEKLFSDPVSAYYICHMLSMRRLQQGQSALMDTYLKVLVSALKPMWIELEQGPYIETAQHLVGLHLLACLDREEGVCELKQWIEILSLEEERVPAWIARLWLDVIPREKQVEVFLFFAQAEGVPDAWKEAYFYLEKVEDAPLIALLSCWQRAHAEIRLPPISRHSTQFVQRAHLLISPRMTEEECVAVDEFWKGKVEKEGASWLPLALEWHLFHAILRDKSLEGLEGAAFSSDALLCIGTLLIQLERPCSEEEEKRLQGYQLQPLNPMQWKEMLNGLKKLLENISFDGLQSFSKRVCALWKLDAVSKQNIWLLIATPTVRRNVPTGWKFLLSQAYAPDEAQQMNDYAVCPLMKGLLESCIPVPTLFHLFLQMDGKKETDLSIPLIELEPLSVFGWLPFLQLMDESPNPLIQTVWADLFKHFVQKVCFIPADSQSQDLLFSGLISGNIAKKLQPLYPCMARLFQRDRVENFDSVLIYFHRRIQEEIRTKLKGGKCIPQEIYRHFTAEGKLFHQAVADKYLEALLTGKPA